MLSTDGDGIVRYLAQLREMLFNMPVQEIEKVTDALMHARARNARVFVLGNGGSAATASHFACDLGKGTAVSGLGRFKVIALTDNVPLLTAWANDASYEDVFVEQLANLLEPGDVVIGISASGNSPNVVKALGRARELGSTTIGFSGFDGGRVKQVADICVVVPSSHMGQIEDGHLIVEHLICCCLREKLVESRAVTV